MITLILIILLVLLLAGRGYGVGGPDLGGVLNILLWVLVIAVIVSLVSHVL